MVRSPLNNDVRFDVGELNEEPREQKKKAADYIADGYVTLDQADRGGSFSKRERKGLSKDEIYSSQY